MCSHCKEATPIQSKANTRPELEQEKGENFVIQCKHCHKNNEKHVNDIKAKANPIILLFGFGIGCLFTAILWIFFGFVATISFLIPILVSNQQAKSAHAFNSYRITRS